jgi:hypothetical protein
MNRGLSGEEHTANEYVCTRLNDDHYLQNFDCGHDSNLTDWLQTKAHAYVEEDLCSVWVLSPARDPEDVAGFFTDWGRGGPPGAPAPIGERQIGLRVDHPRSLSRPHQAGPLDPPVRHSKRLQQVGA